VGEAGVEEGDERDGPDLIALVAELAGDLEEVTSSKEGGLVVYQRRAAVFARVSADALEIRLPDDIADAAERTPDSVALPGQPGWIRFTPRSSERHVIDRTTAWFQTAWRHAGERLGEG
jgi:hypothetical protein